MNDFDKILADLDVEIDEIDLYGYGIIETSLSMVHRLQTVLNDLREKIQTYVFPSKEDENPVLQDAEAGNTCPTIIFL